MQFEGDESRASLRRRVFVLVGALLALVILVSVLSGLLVRSWDHGVQVRGELRVAAGEVTDLRFAYSDQETGIRGFILTGQNDFLDPYRDGKELASATLAKLRSHDFTADVDLGPQLDRVQAAAEAWHTVVADAALDPAMPEPDEEVGQARFDDLRAELDLLDALVIAELDTRDQQTEDAKRTTIAVLLGGSLAAIAAVLLVAVLFHRWVTRPLAEIVESARLLGSDDSIELPDFESRELHEVVEAIRALQRSLAHERDRAVTAYKGLEQSAMLAIQVRSELADALGDPPPGWSVSSALVPAEGVVAGDCYDLGLLDQHRMYVVVVDVTGHGASAALDALKAKSQLRAALRSRLSPGAALEWLSRENAKDDRADLLTAVVAVIDVDSGVCQYANAGHPAPLLFRGDERVDLAPTGPLLGAFASSWTTQSVTIDTGWTLLLHTDGVTEALGPDRERFGDERFADCLATVVDGEPAHVVSELLEAVSRFRVGVRNDDVTLVAVRRHEEASIESRSKEPAADTMATVRA